MADLIWIFTRFRCFLNRIQSLRSFDLMALSLRIFQSCIRFFRSEVIYGQLRAQTQIQ